MMYVLMKGMRQAKTKQQNYQTSVNNVILMSAKTVSNDIIPAVNTWCEEWVTAVQAILW